MKLVRIAIGMLWLASALLTPSSAAAAPAQDEAATGVERGRQVERDRRALQERIEQLHRALSASLQRAAPELLATIAPPAQVVTGYQVLPRVVPNAAPRPPGTPQVQIYSWPHTETLIARAAAELERFEVSLRGMAGATADRAAYGILAEDYRKLLDLGRLIDSHVDYNRFWQAEINRDRPGFDRSTKLLEAALDRHANIPAIRAAMGRSDPSAFVRIEQDAHGEWTVTLPLYTDIADAGFVETFRSAVESTWRTGEGAREYRVWLAIEVIAPATLYCPNIEGAAGPRGDCASPSPGDAIDLPAHLARFPAAGAVLTTAAATTNVAGGRAIVLGPHDIAPHVFAHELGHLLGFHDAYVRGYRDLGEDGFEIRELVVDPADIMGASGTGAVTARHFEQLIAARRVQTLVQSGMDALYQRNDPAEAVAHFREALERHPSHYGAMFQLAIALDRAGRPDEALAVWKAVVEMAEAAADAETIRVARARLGG